MFDMLMNYDEACDFVDKQGWDAFLIFLNKQFKGYKFYSVSKSWYLVDSKYICKARGGKGDIIVGWYGVHDKKDAI